MKNITVVLVCVLLSMPVVAAAQTAQAPSQEETSVSVNWDNLQQSVARLMRALQTVNAENLVLKKRISDMDAYLKACADKPGCTVPAE